MQNLYFYQAHLDRVSRSFAFCIRKLEAPFRTRVSLSYLLCRILDTIEDSPWEDGIKRDRQYDEFEKFLFSFPIRSQVDAWSSCFPHSIPEGESILLRDAATLFEDLHGMPDSVQNDIRSTVMRMSQGMRHYSLRQDHHGCLRLVDLPDVNRYCYFVAGIVGELMTRLYVSSRPDFRPKQEQLKNAFHFGLFLQKVNLLKDQRGDEDEGRYLVPNRGLLLASLQNNARGGIRYLTSLPVDERGYRTFCAWSLFLGLASLPFIRQAFTGNSRAKITRVETQALLAEIEECVLDNEALEKYGAELLSLLSEDSSPEGSDADSIETNLPDEGAWFYQASGGGLARNDLVELGIDERVSS